MNKIVNVTHLSYYSAVIQSVVYTHKEHMVSCSWYITWRKAYNKTKYTATQLYAVFSCFLVCESKRLSFVRVIFLCTIHVCSISSSHTTVFFPTLYLYNLHFPLHDPSNHSILIMSPFISFTLAICGLSLYLSTRTATRLPASTRLFSYTKKVIFT